MDKLRQYEIFLRKAKGDFKIAEKNEYPRNAAFYNG